MLAQQLTENDSQSILIILLTSQKCRLLCEVYFVCHLFISSAALISWYYFSPLIVVMSVVQVFLGRPRDLLPSTFHSISCSCAELCLIRCPRYCNFLVLNCLTFSRPVPILLNTSSLVIFSVHDIFNTLRYTHISNASSLDNIDFVIVHVSAPYMSLIVQHKWP